MSPDLWREIEEVFQAAVELPPADRAAFLDKLYGADNEVKAEVLKLLASDDSASDFIEKPIWTDSAFLNTGAKQELSLTISDKNGDRDNFLGKRVGVYELTREIGRGGMGAVYLAERADGEFQQRVAIKLIKRGMDSDFIIRRFRHERQILASFEHPFIARLLDGGTTDDSVPYFVMEFVEGETLYNYADAKRLDIRARLKLFQKVCSALDYAHEKKIIHRDIKPSNILINKTGSPKLLDFGIAKILDPNLIHESINPTASMLRMMTPDYASPEQVQGLDVTPQSDIYSLGILLYELLTGHKAYNSAGRALHEVSRVICEVMPEPPSKVLSHSENLLAQYGSSPGRFLAVRSTSEKQLLADLRGDLDNIVMKAIAKDPADRYESVGEFSRDITRYLSGSRVAAPSYQKGSRSTPDAFLRVPQNSKALAVLPFKFLNLGAIDDTDDRFLGVGLADALITRLSKVRRFVVRPTSSILGFGDNLIDPIRAGRELNVEYILDGNIKKAGDRLRVTIQLLSVSDNAAVWATSIDETLSDVLTLEDTLSNKVIEVLLPQLTGGELEEFGKRGTDSPEAFEHYLRGRYYFNTFTEDGFAKAFVSFHSAIAADPKYAHAYAGLADYYNWLGILGVLPPQECFQPAIAAATQAIELDDELSEGHASLGFSLHAGNYEWSKAEHHLRRAIDLNPSNANAYVWYSIVLFTEARFDEALDFARRGIELDPLTPFNHHNLGWGLYYARRFEEAADQYRRVISEFPTYSFGYYGLSKIHRITGETRLAIAENDKAKELMANGIFSLLSEAECYAADGQTDAAAAKIATLEEAAKNRYVSPYQMALAYCYLGDNETALERLEAAREIKEAWLNWMGIEPAFDPLRNDPRFDEILEKIGYGLFFKDLPAGTLDLKTDDGENAGGAAVHDLTTLVIQESDKTDDGTRTRELQRSYAKWPFVVMAAIGIFAFSWAFYHFFLERREHESTNLLAPAAFQNPSIVVVPFDSQQTGNSNLGVGLADALTQKLGSIKSLRVLSANTGRTIDVSIPKEVANTLGVAFILKGKLTRDADSITVSADLVNASADTVLWSENFDAPNGDLSAVQPKIAEKIWTSLHLEPLPLERQQIAKTFTQEPRAYEHYLTGRSIMGRRSAENLYKAIDEFNESSKVDPGFVLAYMGLADAYALLNLYDINPPPDAYEKAKEYVQRALTMDDSLAEAHATLAYVKFYGERHRETAELEFRRAIQLNPSSAQAHHWFALVLTAMNDRVEAVSEAQIAQQLDPRSPAVKVAQAMTYLFNGQYPEAIAECDAALELDDKYATAVRIKRVTQVAMKDFAGAKESFQTEMKLSGGSADNPAWRLIEIQVTAPDGDRAGKLKLLEQAVASAIIQQNHKAFAFEVALAYNALGESGKALAWLEKSEAASSYSFHYVEVDPRIKNLRDEPRFKTLVEKLRGPQP